jgi:hypothetical protein
MVKNHRLSLFRSGLLSMRLRLNRSTKIGILLVWMLHSGVIGRFIADKRLLCQPDDQLLTSYLDDFFGHRA